MIRALTFLALCLVARAEIIPETRLPIMRFRETVGVRGSIPNRTTVVNLADYGMSSVSTSNNAVLTAQVAAAASNSVLLFPTGKLTFSNQVNISKSHITLRGQAGTELLFMGNGGLVIGPTPLSSSQGRQFTPSNALACVRGVTNITLTTNQYSNFGAIAAGQMYFISQLNGSDPSNRVISVSGYERSVSQTILIESVSGHAITFSPPLVSNFTNSPRLLEIQSSVTRGFGLEDCVVTLTNTDTGQFTSGTFQDSITIQGSVDSWVTGVRSIYARNYNINQQNCMFMDVRSNYFGTSLTGGTSHSGHIFVGNSGCYVAHNIYEDLRAGVQLWGASTVNNVFFANYFTNCIAAVLFHNTHHFLNVFESNESEDGFFQVDGYYGSNSDMTFFRNRAPSFSIKRFSSRMNFVGNVMGVTTLNLRYDDTGTHPGAVGPVFELGYPNIGNQSTNDISPPMAWNNPGTNYTATDNTISSNYPNGYLVLTNDIINTNWIAGDFTPGIAERRFFTDYMIYYNVIFRRDPDTNTFYYPETTHVLTNFGNGVLLNSNILASNGWRLFISGATLYQQRQTIDNATHIRHGNTVYTNFTYVTVWDSAIADQSIAVSLIHSNGTPEGWIDATGNALFWPANGPDVSGYTQIIPAKARRFGISVGPGVPSKRGPGRSKGSSSGGRRIIE